MSNIVIARDSEIIATEIKIIKNQTAQAVLMASIDIGKRLSEAKELVEHGEWQNWLADKVDYKQSTANNLMRIAKEYENSSEKLKAISYSQAIALLALPDEEREEFASENNIDEMSVRELNEAIKAKEAAEQERDEYKKIADDVSNVATASNDRAEQAETDAEIARQHLSTLQKTVEDIKSKNKTLENNLESEKKKLLDKIAKLEDEKDVISAEVVLPDSELESIRQEEAEKHQKLIDIEKAKVAELETKLKKTSNTAVLEFRLYFENTQSTFNKMIDCVNKIKVDDVETSEKLKGALNSLLTEFNKAL
jgi:predicted  nucleic acid-binding Zn-ribbon protein